MCEYSMLTLCLYYHELMNVCEYSMLTLCLYYHELMDVWVFNAYSVFILSWVNGCVSVQCIHILHTQ